MFIRPAQRGGIDLSRRFIAPSVQRTQALEQRLQALQQENQRLRQQLDEQGGG